ncbi:MAG TPA: tetratricopeptide repeat protein [bacterium (Candidatus Stahlbacteria)]|nr:tetratricopeptide repeat protein [Candidatus Stahlbacteria bacterium]
MMGEELLNRAREAVEEGRFDQALVTLRRLEAESPQDPNINQLLGHIAFRSGDSDEAIKRLMRAYEIFEDRGEYIQAVGCLEELLTIEPDPDRLLALATIYDKIGLKNEAISRLFDKANDMIRSGDDENGLKFLAKICVLDNENVKLCLIFGKMLVYSGQEEKGKDYLNRLRSAAVARNENEIVTEIDSLLAQYDGGSEELDPKSRMELANLLSEIGSAQEAITEYLVAVSDLISMNQKSEARKILHRVLELDPDNMKAKEELDRLGEEVEVTEEVEQAELIEPKAVEEEEITTPAIEEDSDLPPIEAIEGQVADIEFLLKEVESKPRIEVKLSDLLDEFKAAMRPLPEDPNIRLKIGEVLNRLLLFNLAIENYKKLLNVPEFRINAIERLGTTFVRAGKYNEALRYLAEAIVQRPDNLEVRYNLALAYRGMGDHENALKQLSNIISVNPQYRDASDLYRHLGGKREEKPAFRDDIGEVIQKPAPFPEKSGPDDNIVFI